MHPIKKLKSKRGITLVEVLLVVAVMTILLAIAMPNIFAESKAIKLATMDGYARSVAVAVQSKLYGMKNSGTVDGSEYWMLNTNAANQTEIGDDKKPVYYIANFGDKGEEGKAYLLSGAITDTEVLKNGKIVVVYDPDTADVLEVFYSENEFDITKLFPNAYESFLQENMIGLYLGEGAPQPERNIGLPRFSVAWGDDDEKYLELTMVGNPASELLSKHLGLEVYALLPTGEDGSSRDPLLIYAEGLIANPYKAQSVTESPNTSAVATIESEMSNPLTLDKIQQNNKKLRFVIDSMVIPSVDYDKVTVKQMLYRQEYPQYVSMAESVLYPRESLDNWLNKKFNPYISFGVDAGLYAISSDLQAKLNKADAKVTDFVLPNQNVELQVKLYVLKENDDRTYETKPIENGLCSYYVADPNYTPVTVTSQPVNPYFYSSSSRDESVIALASVRDLKNLKYIFETENKIERAQLYHDIDTQQFYDKLTRVRYALIDKNSSVKDLWPSSANADTLQVEQIKYADGKSNGRKSFTISGKNGEGCYAIKNVQNGGADWSRGGFIEYAKNITVEDLDIVNPKIWKIDYRADFIKTSDNGKIESISVAWDNSVSGGLFGVAENCTFKNVHCYNDLAQIFKQEPWEASSYQPESWLPAPMATRYIGGNVAGGLVGIAVGTDETGTTFTDCGASTQVNSYYYGAMAQCIYAGGLVGIAMGNVTIKNSYAACQLSGYYSGGLVGAVAEGPFTYHVNYHQGYWLDTQWHDGWWEAEYDKGEGVKGTLTIENSFSAGHIQRQTMVGGGLIAQTNGVNVTVNNCYSASVWEILPPIAYGTFEGDENNYYLVQNEINVPITLNTEARFTRTAGDVFSLNKSTKCGIAVNDTTLKSRFSLTGNWATASRTLQWWNKGNDGAPTFFLPTDAEPGSTGNKSTPYPFPMQSSNTKFWGDWNQDNATNIGGTFATDFDGYYCVYFKRSDDGYQRFIDAAAVHELEFGFSGTTDSLQVLGKTVINSVTKPEDIWWADNMKADGKGHVAEFGKGVAGMTGVTVDGEKITFTGAAYYNSKYNPTKGYVGIDIIGTKEGESSYYINWDYYGWYVSNGLFKSGYLAPSEDGKVGFGADFSVAAENFKNAIGYGSFAFDKDNATLAYDENKGFHVAQKEG